MAAVALRSEERIGLAVAVAAHAALVALLIWRPHAAPMVTPPDRIEVTISDDVGLKSTSPEPQAKAAPDIAPEIGAPPPPAPMTAPPVPRVAPPVLEPPKPVPRPVALPVPRPEPRPVPKPTMRPEPPRPVAKPTMRPSPRPAVPTPHAVARPSAAADPIGARLSAAKKPVAHLGGSRIGADFLKGQNSQANGSAHNTPAATVGPAVRAALAGEISRQLKPHWQQPIGVDVDKLVTVLSWDLNADGSLAGEPRVVSQTGVDDANRAQSERHKEQAIRAVRLAAPFDLPAQYFANWRHVASFRFDWKLNQ